MRAATYRVFICLSVLLSLPQLALADPYFYCEGPVNSIGVNDGTGRVWVSYSAIGMQGICEVDAASHASSCKAWLALLTAAQAQQRTIRVYYYTSTPGNPTSCAGLQSWQLYSPYYIETVN